MINRCRPTGIAVQRWETTLPDLLNNTEGFQIQQPSRYSNKSTNQSPLFLCLNSKTLSVKQQVKTIQILLACGEDVNSLDATGKTPLMIGVINRSLDCVKALLTSNIKVNINQRDKENNTALQYCFLGSFDANFNLISALIEHGASVNIPNRHGLTPTFLALLGPVNILQLMITVNGNVDSFHYKHFAQLQKYYAFKVHLIDVEKFLKRLHILGCPVLCCKKIGKLYPSDIRVQNWLNDISGEVPTLSFMCRITLRRQLDRNIKIQVTKLSIPELVQHFILMTESMSAIT